MMGSPDPDRNSNGPYPDLRSAFLLTVLAMLAAAFTGIAFIDFGLVAALGIGQAIGIGAVATVGAQRVAEPQAERLGLRALDPKTIPVILCLAPAILLVSELDNFALAWSGDGSAIERSLDSTSSDFSEPAATEITPESSETTEATEEEGAASDLASELVDLDDPWSMLSLFVLMVGISPIVEEFLFRGVIQQGLVARMGLLRGVSMVAILWTLLRPAPIASVSRFLAAAVATFGLGWALGMVRIATDSILGSILLASSWAAIGLSAAALKGRMDLPGMNVEGTHLPLTVSFASVALVAWAGWTIYQEAERRFSATSERPE